MNIKRANLHDPTVPTFRHDCPSCLFLGTVRTKEQMYGGVWDIWWCPNIPYPDLSSVICRYGNEPSEYSAGHPPESCAGPEEYIEHCKKHERPWLFAMARAVKAGLYNGKFAHHFKDAA